MRYRFSFRFVNSAAALCCLLALTAFTADSRQARSQTPAAAQSTQTSTVTGASVRLARHTARPVLDGTAIRISHYSPEQKLRLALFVQRPHMAEEEKFLQELQTKGSPNFHKFLTAEEWNARFAPSAEDEQKVVDWAESQGLAVTNRFANRLIVDVEAPAGVIEKALGITINNYQVGEEVDFANDRDPLIPAHLSGILSSVLGLNSIVRAHRQGTGSKAKKGPDYVPGPIYTQAKSSQGEGDPSKRPSNQSSPRASALSSPKPNMVDTSAGWLMEPGDIQGSQAYDYSALSALGHCCNPHNDSTGSPADSSIGLASFGGFNDSDVTTFFQYYGMAWNYTVYAIDGSNPPPGAKCTTDCTLNSDDGEGPLDLEYSTAMANSYGSVADTAHVYIYEGVNNLCSTIADVYNFMLSDGNARSLSTSYGWAESDLFNGCGDETAMHGIFNSMAGAGWTLVAAAGDDGSTDICDSSKDTATVSVDYPGSDPNFVSVGGTRLDLDSNGNFVSEITWNSGGSPGCWGAGGGGVSSYFSQPSWQNGLTYLESIAGQEYVVSGNTMRFVPDISLNAGAGQYYYDGGWDSVYGTSIGAPELAGFFAQENSYLNFIGHICGSDGTSRCEPIGNPNWILYGEGKNPSAPHYPFYDITSECNYSGTGLGLGLTEYCADSGYDLATGWGTANMLQLAWTINWDTIPADGSPSVNFSSSNPATGVWYNSNQNVDWTVSDSGSGGLPAPGVAGFTQGWDSVPTDPYSEPNGGSGNSFYSGPEFPNATSGCLGLNNTNCGYSPGQGCHTVHVMAWDNQGNSTGDQTYGPLCYDTVAPTVSINTSVAVSGTGWFNISTGVPNVSFSATDPGGSNASGVQTIYGVLGPTTCSPSNMSTCQTYGGPFPIPQGASPVMAFSKDNAGNYSSVDSVTYYVDTVAPVTTISVVGEWNNNTSTSAVTVNLTATDATSGVQTTYYTLNGGPANVYSSPFVISAAGSHTLKYWSVDYAGNTEAKHTKTFAIQSPTTATLVASPNPSVLGQSVTMTATIKATLTGTPTGSVVFWNGATNLGTAKLSGGIATLSTTALPLGALTLQASFLGSTYYAATNSAPFDQTVNESTTTTVSSSPNPAAFGQSVTLTATVAPSNSGTPTGTVGFYVSGNFVGSAPMSGSVATVATTFVPGSYAITAVYSGDATYLSSTSSNTLTETVAKASQTITFPAITGTQYALSNLALTATASSGLPISYSSTTTTVCTVSGGTLSLLTSGTCVVHAAQAGNSDYSAAATVAQSFAVHAVSQTITFPAITQTPFALTQITLVATATSGLPVTITSITPTVCTVSGFTASLLVPGTCVLHAAQAGNSDYSPAPTLAQDFTVVKAQQSITFPAITGTQYALSKVTLTATASSSLAVAYTSTTPTVCTVSGSTASLLASGTCVLHANQAGNTLYAAASMVAQSFSVHLIAQTITFPAITGTQYAGSQLTLTATASSGLAVSYTSTTTTVCTVSGNTASLLTAGTCVLHASQAGNSDYAAAPTLAQSFAVKAAVN